MFNICKIYKNSSTIKESIEVVFDDHIHILNSDIIKKNMHISLDSF